MSSNPQPTPQPAPQPKPQPATQPTQVSQPKPALAGHTEEKPKKKITLNSVVSWGATVVIIGLMFKIQHWKNGEWFITIGLTAEAVLFLILGFSAMAAPAHTAEEEHKKASGLDDLLATAITPKVI